MPFRCKCGRTFEKVETFGSHTSGCATFHHRRVSTSDINKQSLTVQISPPDFFSSEQQQQKKFSLLSPTYNDYFFRGFSSSVSSSDSAPPPPPKSTPVVTEPGRFNFMMPTALSIQNTFEGAQRKRSMSYTTPNTTAYK